MRSESSTTSRSEQVTHPAMKSLVQCFLVGAAVILASFPLKSLVPEPALVWVLAGVAAMATALVKREKR